MTLLDSRYVLTIMYELNAIPLALQITNICGNVLVRSIIIQLGFDSYLSWESNIHTAIGVSMIDLIRNLKKTLLGSIRIQFNILKGLF